MQKIVYISLMLLLVVNVVYVSVGVIFHPMQSMDTIGIWMLKAKAFYLEGGFPLHMLKSSEYNYSHQQYPILLPFLFSFGYSFIDAINEKAILSVYPLFYTIILYIIYRILRTKTSRNISLLFTYMYSMFSPLLGQGGRVHAGNADIVLVLLVWIIIYVLYALKGNKYSLYIITLCIMIASQVKMEGAFLSVLILFLSLPFTKKILLFFFSLLPFFAWMVTVHFFSIPSDIIFFFPSFSELVYRLVIIIAEISKEMANFRNWYIFWLLVGISIFLRAQVTKIVKQLIPAVLLIFSLYFVVYLFSTTDTQKYVSSSIDRVLLQLSPWFFIFLFEKTLKLKS